MEAESRIVKAFSRSVRALLVALSLALALASCGGLTSGIFSTELAQMSARLDLSAEIPAADASSFRLSIVKLLGIEYVLLFSSNGADPDRTHLFVLNPSLEVQNRYSMSFLDASVPPATTTFAGDTALARLLDNTVIVGNLVAAQAGTGLAPASKLPMGAALRGMAVVGPSPSALTVTDFYSMDDGSIHYTVYDSAWNAVGFPSVQAGPQVWLRGVFSDPGDASSNVALLVLDDSSTCTFVQVPKVPDLAGGWSSPSLLGTAYPQFTWTNLDGSSVCVTSLGIVGYDRNTQSWVRFLPSSPQAGDSLYVGQRDSQVLTAFSYADGYYCTFDPTSRVLARYEKWW